MPTGAQIHHDRPLEVLAIKAFQGSDGFVGQALFPTVSVPKESDRYYTISKEQWLRVNDTRRARKTKSNRIEFDVSSDSYFCENYTLAGDNALEDLANQDQAIMLRESTTENVVEGLLRDKENRIANQVTSLTNLGSGIALTGTAKWSDYTASDPIANVTTAHAFIRQNTGLLANTMVMDYDTIQVVRRHPVLLDYFKYTQGGMLTMENLKTVFSVDQILVANAIKNNAAIGATASITNIWGNCAILARVVPGVTKRTATFGLGFAWTPEGFPAPMSVQRQVFAGAGTNNIEVIEVGYFQDEKIVAKDLAYGITGTL